MVLAAAIIGPIAGLCAIMGIITAMEVIPVLMPQLTWTFWFVLSAVLFLATITLLLSRSQEY